MASEKPNQRDRLPPSNSLQQINEELGFGSINDGIADDFPNLNMLQPSPHLQFVATHGIPQSYYQELQLPDINSMSDVSQFNSSQILEIDHDSLYGSVSDFPHSAGNLLEICQLPTLNDTVNLNAGMNAATHVNDLQKHQIDRNYVTARDSAVGCLQMCRQGGEANARNTHMPQLTGNSICRGGSTPLLGHARGMISAVQSDYPEKLDGSFLTLGVGGNTAARSNFNVSSRDIGQRTERNVHPQLTTSSGQIADISLLNLDNMAHGFSSFQSKEGGFPNVAQNVGGFSSLAQNVGGYPGLPQNVGGYSGLAQNVGGLTEWPSLSCNDLQVMYSNSTRFNSSSSHASQTLQVDKHHYNNPNNWNLGLGENRNVRFAKIEPHKGFQNYQAIASVPPSSSQAGMPDSGEFRVPDWPSLSSFMSRKTTQSTCGQLQQNYTGSDGNFSSEPYMVSPFVGIGESNTEQDQSVSGQQFPGYQGSATQTTETGLFPKSRVRQFANQTFPAKQGCAGQVAKDPMNVGVQPASNLDRPQPTGLVQASKNLLGPTGQVIPVANVSGLPSQASNVPVRPSRKRSATQPPPAAPVGQRRKARSRIPIRPSIPNLSQTAPPITPLAQIARPSLAQTTLPPMAKAIPPIHIKWEGPDGTPRPSGLQCVLCRRDISYMPDGPFVQPAVPPAVAVLPCGHCFHDDCLQRITPEDQAKNPPCIPCVIGDT